MIRKLEGLYLRRKICASREIGNNLLCTSVAGRMQQLAKRPHKLVLSLILYTMLPAVREDRYSVTLFNPKQSELHYPVSYTLIKIRSI